MSPGCSSRTEKSIVLPSILAGVPVLNLPNFNPIFSSDKGSSSDESSPILPALKLISPICISPLKKVPVAMITILALYSKPSLIFIPFIIFFPSSSSTTSSLTIP